MSTTQPQQTKKVSVAQWSSLPDRQPQYALVADVDLVVVRYDNSVSVLYGRCQHRGALLADGSISGHNLICGVHNWDYRYDTGVSEYNNGEFLHKFNAWIDTADDAVYVDETEILAWRIDNPQPYQRNDYLGWIARARREATFQKRLAQMLDELEAEMSEREVEIRPQLPEHGARRRLVGRQLRRNLAAQEQRVLHDGTLRPRTEPRRCTASARSSHMMSDTRMPSGQLSWHW